MRGEIARRRRASLSPPPPPPPPAVSLWVVGLCAVVYVTMHVSARGPLESPPI